jgi:hypothetical protein
MKGNVFVMSPAKYAEWVAQKSKAGQSGGSLE